MVEVKTCHTCKRKRPRSEFAKSKRSKDGLQYSCRSCMTEAKRRQRDRDRAHIKAEIRARRSVKAYDKKLKYDYNMSRIEYEELLKSQGGHCAICPSTKKLCVDHDHKTGKVRGILCGLHNVGLGMFGDDIPSLKKAIAYLSP